MNTDIMKDKTKVMAIACSTNSFGKTKVKLYKRVKCNSTIQFTAQWKDNYANMRFICPRKCSLDFSNVYGTDIYSDKSSLCKAAIHHGIIKDVPGGIIEIVTEPGMATYKGSRHSNIKSHDQIVESKSSFRVKPYKPYCPVDKYVLKTAPKEPLYKSFLEVDQKANVVDTEEEKKNYNKASQNQHSKFKNNIGMLNGETFTLLKKFLNERKKINQNQKSNKEEEFFTYLANLIAIKDNNSNSKSIDINDEKTSKEKNGTLDPAIQVSRTEFEKLGSFIPNPDNRQPLGRVKKAPVVTSSIDDFFLGKGPKQKNILTTNKVLLQLENLTKRKEEMIIEVLNQSQAFNKVTRGITIRTFQIRNENEKGLIAQKNASQEIDLKLKELQQLLIYCRKRTNEKLKSTLYSLNSTKDNLNKLLSEENFTEDYTSDFTSNYSIYISPLGKGEQPKWNYFLYNEYGHMKVIKQENSFMDNRTV